MISDIRFYYELLRRRLPVMVVIFILCAGFGVGLALTMPAKYKADASLLVEGAQISNNLVTTTVQTPATEALQILQKQLLARSNLIDIASKHRVFAGRLGVTPDEVVDEMRASTNVNLSSGRNRATIMQISFTSLDPEVSANVVNEFVTLVLRADAERRTGESGQTLEFFEQRVNRLTEQLATQSEEIVAFKEANEGALPSGLAYRLGRQATLTERLNLAARDRTALEEQRNSVLAFGNGVQTQTQMTPQLQELNRLETELRSKLAIYAPDSPTIKFLRKKIELLKSGDPIGGEGEVKDSVNTVLDMQLAQLDSRIASLDEEKRIIESELAELQVAIDRTPQVAIQLEKLDREYANTQMLYDRSVAARSTAEQGVDVEVNAKGERVTVIEQASVPSSPTSPNRKLIAGGGVFFGSGLAAAFFALTELLNRSIRRPNDLMRGLGVQPLATIPFLEESSVRRRRRLLKTIFVFTALIAIPLGLWALHTYYLPLDLLFESIAGRIGL